jgi:hypothetical protein
MEDLSVVISNTIMPDKNTSLAATNQNVEKFIKILSPVLKKQKKQKKKTHLGRQLF